MQSAQLPPEHVDRTLEKKAGPRTLEIELVVGLVLVDVGRAQDLGRELGLVHRVGEALHSGFRVRKAHLFLMIQTDTY